MKKLTVLPLFLAACTATPDQTIVSDVRHQYPVMVDTPLKIYVVLNSPIKPSDSLWLSKQRGMFLSGSNWYYEPRTGEADTILKLDKSNVYISMVQKTIEPHHIEVYGSPKRVAQTPYYKEFRATIQFDTIESTQ